MDIIIGENRPIINKKYQYTLKTITTNQREIQNVQKPKIDNAYVDPKRHYDINKPKEIPKFDALKVITWKMYLGKTLMKTSTNGIFTFAVSNQKYTLVATINNKEVARTTLHTLGGKPAIQVYWRDDYGQKIGNKTIGYLDKVYLIVKTSHIPVGDTLQVTIYEDEYVGGHGDSSRNMGAISTTPVNKNGYAQVYFTNMQAFKKALNDGESEHEFYAKIVYDSHIATIYDKTQLKVKNQLIKLIDPPVTNMPNVVGEVEKGPIPKTKKKIDFTFGVVLDGTLNNLYNSEARQKFEEKHGVASNQSDVKIHGEKKYRYKDESSYENDLSNPAIIYQNYIPNKKNETHPVFSIYTEGIGTITKPDDKGQLNDENYKNDSKIGYGLGVTGGPFGNYGIKKKVRQACEEMSKKIIEYMSKKPNYVIGTITVDVFGFSRGAAAARNFVHEITYPAYHASAGLESYRTDQHGYTVADKYWTNTLLPTNGHLGYMLTQGNQTFDKLEIRFAGLYDTVPHHGIVQKNDAEDLGLHSISKANYVVHMAAADEHRKNFSLVGINTVNKTPASSGKKGGIELFMPGVHCDVGGSYVDEKPEPKKRIDAMFDYHELKKLKEELIRQGWFKPHQIFILGDGEKKIDNSNYKSEFIKLILNSKRDHVSNQYSFIPLHLMAEFCKIKEVMLDEGKIKNKYQFTNKGHITNNIQFLERIKTKLHQYAFEGGAPLQFIELEHHEPNYVTSPENAVKARIEFEQRKKAGQEALNKIAATKNADIMFLRNNHLHWNSVYGHDDENILLQGHAPRIENDKRKRKIR